MQQEKWGDERKESRREGREDGIFKTRPLEATWLMYFCVNVHYLLSILNGKVTSHCFSLGESLLCVSFSLSPGSGI